MSQPGPNPWHGGSWRLPMFAALRIVVSLAALFAAYYALPAREAKVGTDLPWLALSLCAYAVVVAVQLPLIAKSSYPIIRAVEKLALAVPVFLLIFARTYLSSSLSDPTSFTEPLDKTSALYFTVSCFATVGFGDVVASSNPMRLLVTVQMLLDLVVLGVVVKLFASAARRGVAERAQEPGVGG